MANPLFFEHLDSDDEDIDLAVRSVTLETSMSDDLRLLTLIAREEQSNREHFLLALDKFLK